MKSCIKFLAICATIGAMFVYFTPADVNAETAYAFSESGEAKSLKSLGVYTVTAYCPCRKCCGRWADGITASGVYAKERHTIAAPKNFKFGTKLIINGIEYTVEDRGGMIKNRKLGIFMSSHAECLKFGKQRLEVFCYE